MKTRISTLTPLHVGTGIDWQPKFEYVYFRDQGVVAVLDAEKVLSILGEENLHQWVSCIEKSEPLLPLLERRKPKLAPEDISTLIIRSTGTQNKPIKGLIRTEALGVPLLPGSSLKGAIRTAIFAHLLLANHKLAKKIENLGKDRRDRMRWDDGGLESIFFGSNSNQDVFRVLRPGDAHFPVSTETCVVKSVNKYNDEFRIKDSLTQVVEAIPRGAEASFRLSVHEILIERSKDVKEKVFNKNVYLVAVVKSLFSAINNHTLRLVEDEIDYWSDYARNPECIGDYVDEMVEIKNEINKCSDKECVLRIGWGSGFRFMTGDWHGEMIEKDYDLLIRSLRPRHPVDLIFPKTMRIIDGGTPLGFVKISI